ncbi:N-acyl-D-amino-acid deacylase family protein [Marinobacter salexigens]|uniref:D-aminoacylase n=1 Tax=Marinobacter salexigens TaxID=1925763 RepID=A0ABS6A7S8_9GAMM|nr:D-aminoacylase [Marinobacter salexigens]MBU2874176.1 D-aminoacylase [Marinobacter salexigens]
MFEYDDFDIIIINGRLIDGSGRPEFLADLGIKDDRIVKIGDLEGASAKYHIDATGKVVAPGFIDVHTHDDASLILRPDMTPKLSQGVTTVICGNCGISGAPYSSKGNPPGLLRLVFKSDAFVAESMEAFIAKVEGAKPTINSAFLVGHTTLRMEVMGDDDLNRTATDEEIILMRSKLKECMEQGAIGLSTGLFYEPAFKASTEEVIGVAKVLKEFGGIYATHMRDEADKVIESVEETLEIGRQIDAHVIISHHKCQGKRNFGKSTKTLELIREAKANQSLALDVYPYDACSTVLEESMVKNAVRTLISWSDPHPEFTATYLDDVAEKLGCNEQEAIEKLQPAGAIYFMMDEGDVKQIMASPDAMIGSDGLPEDKHPHPRLWGTFPRVLGRYVREQKLMTLEEGVHRMTGLSAQQFGLVERGRLKEGMFADVTVFDPDKIIDTSTFEKPISKANGIDLVIVNGQVVWQNGQCTGSRPGKVLKRPHVN